MGKTVLEGVVLTRSSADDALFTASFFAMVSTLVTVVLAIVAWRAPSTAFRTRWLPYPKALVVTALSFIVVIDFAVLAAQANAVVQYVALCRIVLHVQ
jgi:hypothetical protein